MQYFDSQFHEHFLLVMQGVGLPKKIYLFRKGTQCFFLPWSLSAQFSSEEVQLSHNGAQHSSEEAILSHNGAQYSSREAQLSSEEAQLSMFSSYEVCVQRNCGVSASAQVVYERKTIRVGYHAS